MVGKNDRKWLTSRNRLCLGFIAAGSVAPAGLVPMTLKDFHLFSTQVGDVSTTVITASDICAACHGDFDSTNEPFRTWRGSLMGQAGRDPLFYAQMATAKQDVENVGIGLADVDSHSSCMSGPAVGAAGGCECADFEGDGDADLADFLLFQRGFTGE